MKSFCDIQLLFQQLRLLYEAAPMAFIMSKAGGKATTGLCDILDIVPETIHQRVPIICGSPADVDEFISVVQKNQKN